MEKEYQTTSDLETANIAWKQNNFQFKAQNGQYYPTMDDVKVANQQYFEEKQPRSRGR